MAKIAATAVIAAMRATCVCCNEWEASVAAVGVERASPELAPPENVWEVVLPIKEGIGEDAAIDMDPAPLVNV